MSPEKAFSNIGNNVKKYRLKKGYSQELLAEKLNKTVNYISLIENGKASMTVYTLIDIANVLGVPIGNMFDECDKVLGRVSKYRTTIH